MVYENQRKSASCKTEKVALSKGEGPRSSKVGALLAAAAAIPSLGAQTTVAQSVPTDTTVRFQYSYYEDWLEGRKDRITVKAPMLWFQTPVAEKWKVEGHMVLDTVSGASPLFHDTLTGASGTGIEDERNSGDLTATRYFDRYSVSLGGVYSTEEDYDSQGLSSVVQIWTEDKNTTFSFGLNAVHNRVRSTNNPDLDELRRDFGGYVGVTQVINKHSLIQSNITYATEEGYLSDPYKTADVRPENRDRIAWLTRYVRYFPSPKASLHFDYRYYRDSWSIISHMFEAKWYQPLGEGEKWLLRPGLRYYTQSKAGFFSNDFPPPDGRDGAYTADSRLSGFANIGTGLKLIRQFEDRFSAHISADYVYTNNGLKLGSEGSPNLDDLYAFWFSLGFEKKF